jgi:DnaJ like chaperone protein
MQVAVSDGIYDPEEERMIRSAVRIFEFPEEAYIQLKDMYVEDFKKYYAILGCSETDTMETIKNKHRKLVKDYHPDTIHSKGLPEEFTIFANKKFAEIQESYEKIKEQRV